MSTSSVSSLWSYEPDYVSITNDTQIIKVKMNNFTESDMTVVAERRLLTIIAQHEMRWEIDGFASRHYVKRFKLVNDANLNRISSFCKLGFLIIGVFRTGNTNPDESQPTSVNVEIVSASLASHIVLEGEAVERSRQDQPNPTGEENSSGADDIPSSSAAKSTKRKKSSSSDTSHDELQNGSVNKAMNLSGNVDDAKTFPRSATGSDSPTADDIRPTTSDHHSAAKSERRDKTPSADATMRDNPSSANAIPPSNNPTIIIENEISQAATLFNSPTAGPRFNPTPNVMRLNNPTANARPRFNPILIAAPRFIPNNNATHGNNPAGSIPRFNTATADGTTQLNYFGQPR